MRERAEYMRRVILRPYTKESKQPYFILTLLDTVYRNGRDYVRYTFEQVNADRSRVMLFAGEDFGSSPLHGVDSDSSVAALLSFLTLQEGNTDAEYFAEYTEEQWTFSREHAEHVSMEVLNRFGER